MTTHDLISKPPLQIQNEQAAKILISVEQRYKTDSCFFRYMDIDMDFLTYYGTTKGQPSVIRASCGSSMSP